MTSLLKQCALAAFVAAVVSASVSVAQDSRPGIGTQIEALGLDRAEVRAKLDSLSRDERITYLQSLGIQLPGIAARPDAAVTPGTVLMVSPGAKTAIGTAAPLPVPGDGKVTILPWTGTVDGKIGADAPRAVQLPALPRNGSSGSVSSGGTVVSDRPATGPGAGSTAPASPARP